mmetsp:Transcript_6554/g.14156  ORF Transcript_6554/g.14156 Transcript_6554/m.14156 type:complete len:86 (-) Transcript_6554:719-976(-)
MSIQSHDPSLIGLRHIGKDTIDHWHEHPILEGMTGVFNNRDDVDARLGHIDKVAAWTMGELHGVYGAFGTDHVRDVRHRCAGGGA